MRSVAARTWCASTTTNEAPRATLGALDDDDAASLEASLLEDARRRQREKERNTVARPVRRRHGRRSARSCSATGFGFSTRRRCRACSGRQFKHVRERRERRLGAAASLWSACTGVINRLGAAVGALAAGARETHVGRWDALLCWPGPARRRVDPHRKASREFGARRRVRRRPYEDARGAPERVPRRRGRRNRQAARPADPHRRARAAGRRRARRPSRCPSTSPRLAPAAPAARAGPSRSSR